MAQVGDKVEAEHLITQEMVNQFAQLTGDKNPIHLDAEYAAGTSFGRPIAHGILIASFFSALVAQELPGPGSIYMSQDFKFKKPAFVGDKVKVQVEVLKLRSGKPIYTLQTRCFNAAGDMLLDGHAIIYKPA